MKPLLLVDGYNVIGAWETAAKKGWSFEECREKLTAGLEEYAAFHGCEVILVFDGTRSERLLRSHETRGGVEVVFTRHGEIADQYIERLCDTQPRWREIRVATSDNVEQTVVLGRGATRLPSRELLREMAQARSATRDHISRTPAKTGTLISRLPKAQRDALERMRRGEE